MNDVIGFVVFLIFCVFISMVFYWLLNDKSKKTDQQRYEDMVKCEPRVRHDFEGDFIE